MGALQSYPRRKRSETSSAANTAETSCATDHLCELGRGRPLVRRVAEGAAGDDTGNPGQGRGVDEGPENGRREVSGDLQLRVVAVSLYWSGFRDWPLPAACRGRRTRQRLWGLQGQTHASGGIAEGGGIRRVAGADQRATKAGFRGPVAGSVQSRDHGDSKRRQAHLA